MNEDWLETNRKTVQESVEKYVRETKPIDSHIVERELSLEGGLIMPVTTTIRRESEDQNVFYTAEYNNLHLRYGFGEIPYNSWSHPGTVTVCLSLAGEISLKKREGEKKLWEVRTGHIHNLGEPRFSRHDVPFGYYDLGCIAKYWGLDESYGRKRRLDPKDTHFDELLREIFGPLNEKFKPTYVQIIRKEYDILRSL